MTDRALSCEPSVRIVGATGGYGDLTILHGIDAVIPARSWTTIIGANGAGKSTLLKLIAGRVGCRTGSIEFEGTDLTHRSALERLARGIGFVPQGRCNFPLLTVGENLKLGAYSRRLDRRRLDEELTEITERFPRLKDRWSTLAGNLSGGEQQIMEMAMVLLCRPRLLLLDEPSLGLSPLAMDLVFDTIRELVGHGMTVLMVEQNAQQALERCDYGMVLELGRVALFDRSAAVLTHPDIRKMFLGL